MQNNVHPIHPAAMLNLKQVLEMVPVSHTQIYRMMNSGDFPRSVNVGGRRVAWYLADILAWIANRPPPKQYFKE